MRALHAVAAVTALLVAGCGGADDIAGQPSASPDETTQTGPASPPPEPSATDTSRSTTGAAPADDVAAIENVLITWDLEGGCQYMTDGFLEDLTFTSDREEACTAFEQSFIEKQYTADDLVITDVKVSGDKATADFGSTIASVTLTYKLVREGGSWKIDDFTF